MATENSEHEGIAESLRDVKVRISKVRDDVRVARQQIESEQVRIQGRISGVNFSESQKRFERIEKELSSIAHSLPNQAEIKEIEKAVDEPEAKKEVVGMNAPSKKTVASKG
jgi:uncharacterized protein YukE